MAVFDSSIALATRLIIKYGEAVTWRKVTANPVLPDVDKPWEPGVPITVEYPTRILFLPFNKEDRQWMKYLKDTEVRTGSIQ